MAERRAVGFRSKSSMLDVVSNGHLCRHKVELSSSNCCSYRGIGSIGVKTQIETLLEIAICTLEVENILPRSRSARLSAAQCFQVTRLSPIINKTAFQHLYFALWFQAWSRRSCVILA